jgi:polynucleotide 5'-kinase involved in rRNA processing
MAAAAQFVRETEPDALFQLAPYSPGPLSHQTIHLLAHLLLNGPDMEILVAEGAPLEQSGFPVGPTIVKLDKAFPSVVQAAQRKAQWLAFFERAESQTLDLSRIAIEGGRLGAGTRLRSEELPHGALYGEKAGASLFLVTGRPLEDHEVARALDHTHTSRAHVVQPEDYKHLFVGLTRENGEDFALGIVQSIDFNTLEATLLSDAVPPAPARLLRLGSIKVTKDGPEPHETKHWTL